MDVILRAWRAVPWSTLVRSLQSPAAQHFGAGCLLGILAACGCGQYLAHWGGSGPIERGLTAALLIGLVGGLAIQRATAARWPLCLMLSATISLILPWWLDCVGSWLRIVPESVANSDLLPDLLGFGLALASLSVPVLCWTVTICALCETNCEAGRIFSPLARAGLGCASGVILHALCWGPLFGAEVASIAASAAALTLSYYAIQRRTESLAEPCAPPSPAARAGLTGLIGLLGCGGALAASRDLANLLMPPSAYLLQITWGVIIAGVVVGMLLSAVSSRRATIWGLCLVAVALSCNGWAFELGLRFSLWSAAFLVNVTLHQFALILLLTAFMLPISIGGGLLIGTPSSKSLIAGAVCLLLGQAALQELSMAVPALTLRVSLLCGLSGLAASLLLGAQTRPSIRWQRASLAAGLACGALAPWLQPEIDPARPAKLLFSTQTFLASRSGWNLDLLSHLDDSRWIATSQGRHGPLTLWKSRGADLLLREAGIPRCVVACNPAISPQAPSEVLQAVFPLMLARESRHVLLLGSSGGVPLSTLLNFPVEMVTCVESDAQRLAMIRGPIAVHAHSDSLADDRVRIDRRPVELAAAMSDGGYDLILSSPPPSPNPEAAGQFTAEFYRNASRKLSEHGLFCQRLEAVDYGPVPVQLVVKSLLTAFRDVVGIEIGAGEYLFVATNSEQGLAPKTLPDRLETPNVRRVLARCGWDWSTLLTLPAWDRAALQEFAHEGPRQGNTAANCRLASVGPRDVLRWGPKLQEVQTLLTKPRADSENAAESTPNAAAPAQPVSRRARYLDWLGQTAVSSDVLRRLSEIAAQGRIIHDNPDSFWLEYRKALRDELQQRPRTEIKQVAYSQETERVLHREDVQRKRYFEALGAAGDLENRNLDAVYALQQFFEPYDPLVSLFARQEMAELLRYYGHPDPATEIALRLHVILYAPSHDCSLRNVLAAAELMLEYPDAISDPQTRFDTLNGLLQVIRTRWDGRAAAKLKSVRLVLQDVDRSMLVIERVVAAMDELVAAEEVDAAGWPARKEVVERVLVRPLRGYRAELLPMQQESKTKTEAALMEARARRKK